MKILFLTVGKALEPHVKEGIELFKKRISNYFPVQWQIVPMRKNAANKIDDEFKYDYPNIEWRKMAATRNQFIHHYFGIDFEIFWDIIENKIPDLHFFIKKILVEHSSN